MGEGNDRKYSLAKHAKEDSLPRDINEPTIRVPFGVIPLISFDILWIMLGCVASFGLGTIPVLLYFILGRLIDSFAEDTELSPSMLVSIANGVKTKALLQNDTNSAAFWMAMLSAVALVAGFVSQVFLTLAHDRIGLRLKAAYFRNLIDQEIGYFDIKRTGELVAAMTDSLEGLQSSLSLQLGKFFESISQVGFGIVMALIASAKMSLVMLSTMPLVIFLMVFATIVAQLVSYKLNLLNMQGASVASEVVSSIRTVRSMDGEEKEKRNFVSVLKSGNWLFAVKSMSIGSAFSVSYGSVWGGISLAFWFGGKLSIRGEITAGNMFEVFGYIIMSVLGMITALQIIPEFSKANNACIALLKVVKRTPVLRTKGGIVPDGIEGNIELREVQFAYPSRPDVQVLKNFSLKITPGQSVALVGASGSGKSTIIGLLEKFYVPDSGEIYLDGNNLNDIDPRWLHRNVAIVTQEPTLFANTIKNNILYAVADKEVSDESVIEAAKAANAHDFIMALPKGYDTPLGERGVSLSGGQKQRIAIARAMVQNPAVLLLDEATSALDTQSEALVQDALIKLMKGRTSIVIAHRLSTVVDCDVICVMQKGELKEKGTHDELIQIPNGYYLKLAQKQLAFGDHSKISRNEETSLTDNLDSPTMEQGSQIELLDYQNNGEESALIDIHI